MGIMAEFLLFHDIALLFFFAEFIRRVNQEADRWTDLVRGDV